MANALTKQIMATIVERCEGYKPMKAAEPAQAAGLSAAKTTIGSALNQREEALLSKIIHKQTPVTVEQSKVYKRSESMTEKTSEVRPVNLKETAAYKRDGVVSLDALIKEIKR